MRWVAIFEDRKDSAAVRAVQTEAHQAFLRAHKGKIRLAGAMRQAPGEAPQGGLWVFDAESREEVEAIIAQDPFFVHGLRAACRIMAWGTAPGFEDVVL
ncbi:MAG: YciI family protein [Devosia sp.]|nr:YciI family protein [Devosia sp.]